MEKNTLQHKELAQSRPSGTTAVVAYQPSTYAEISNIIIANTTGSAVDYSLYLDQDGTTYDETTTLAFGISLPANSTTIWDLERSIPIFSTGAFAVQTSSANALNFSIYGHEKVQQ